MAPDLDREARDKADVLRHRPETRVGPNKFVAGPRGRADAFESAERDGEDDIGKIGTLFEHDLLCPFLAPTRFKIDLTEVVAILEAIPAGFGGPASPALYFKRRPVRAVVHGDLPIEMKTRHGLLVIRQLDVD